MKNKREKYKFKKWWWRWLKPKDWDIDLTILKIAETNKANEVFVEQQKEDILEKYFNK